MQVVAFLNKKGGVGKTSTCHHLAGSLAPLGLRVLMVDNDPQASLTQGLFGKDAAMAIPPSSSVHGLYLGSMVEHLATATGIDGVSIVPGSPGLDAENRHLPEDERARPMGLDLFAEAVREARGFDLCLVDCPPNLQGCSWAALAAADGLVVPLQAEDYGAQGVVDVQAFVGRVRRLANPGLRLLGYLITMFEPRKNLHKFCRDCLRDAYGPDVFGVEVPRLIEFAEAITDRKPVGLYKPSGKGASAMDALAHELLARLALESAPAGAEVA